MVHQNQQETNWPEAPTIQIPGVSSMTDQPLEVKYNSKQAQSSAENLKIPVLVDDSDEDHFADFNTFMTQHNTHHTSEHMQQEYFAHLQDLSDDQYYTKIDRADFPEYTPAVQYDWLVHHQMLQDDPQKNSKEYLEKAEVKPDAKNFIATNHLATEPTLWKAAYNGRSRRISACMKGILPIINISIP